MGKKEDLIKEARRLELIKQARELESNEPQKSSNEILNERHPGISVKSRFMAKNLGGKPEAVINYLRKQNPNLEFKMADGEIIAKTPSETSWKKLDPSTFEAEDIGDIALDTVSGIGQAAGTVGGFLAGGIPGGMAASAGGSALSDYVRQKGGEFVGMEDNVDPTQIALGAGVSGVLPLATGFGATKQVLAKKLAEKGLSGEALKTAVETAYNSQKGALGKAYDYTAGKVGKGAASLIGYKPEWLEEGYQMIKDKQLNKYRLNPELADREIQDIEEKIISSAKTTKGNIGKNIEEEAKALTEAGVTVDSKILLTPLLEQKKQLEALPKNEANLSAIKEIDDLIRKSLTDQKITEREVSRKVPTGLFDASGKPISKTIKDTVKDSFQETPEQLNPLVLRNFIDNLNEASSGNMKNIGTAEGLTSGMKVNDGRVLAKISEAIGSSKQALSEAAGPESKYVKNLEDYSKLKDYIQDIQNPTKTTDAFERLLSKNTTGAKALRKRITEQSGVDIEKEANKAMARKLFADPQWTIPSFGQSNTFRSLGAATAGATAAGGADASTNLLFRAAGGALGYMGASPAGMANFVMKPNAYLREELPQTIPMRALPYTLMNLYEGEENGNK